MGLNPYLEGKRTNKLVDFVTQWRTRVPQEWEFCPKGPFEWATDGRE